MSVKIEIVDYKYSEGNNMADVNEASSGLSSGWTAPSSTNAAWVGSGNGSGITFLSNISSQSLVIGNTYNLSFKIYNYGGTGDMGFSTSSGVPSTARFSGNTSGLQSFTFIATANSFPDLYGRDTNQGNISSITIVNASVVDWDNSVAGELDITDHSEFPLALTFQISDFKNLTSTSGDYSKTFKIPATKNNNNLLKHLYIPNIDNNNEVTDKKSCRILFNNLYSLVGLIQVDGVSGYGETPSYYNCVFFGSNLTWSSGLEDAYMNDIEWGSYGEGLTYTKNSITPTWKHENCDNESKSPIVYPITSYGDYNEEGIAKTIQLLDDYSTAEGLGAQYAGHYGFTNDGLSYGNPEPVSDWRPAVFVKTTLDKIFNDIGGSLSAGYKINSAFMETDMFKKLVWLLPNFNYNDPDQRALDYSVRSNFLNEVSMSVPRNPVAGNPQIFPEITEDGVQMFYQNPLSEDNQTVGNGIDKGNYFYSGAGQRTLELETIISSASSYNLNINLGDSHIDLNNNYVTIAEYGKYKVSLNGLQSKVARVYKGGSIKRQIESIDSIVNIEVQTVGHSGDDSWVRIGYGDNSHIINDNVNENTERHSDYQNIPSITLDRYFNKGDKIRIRLGIRLFAETTTQNFIAWIFFSSKNNSNFNIELDALPVYYGQTYNLKDVISKDYKQVDFIKGIAHAFNLQMNTDESTNTVNIEPFDSFYKPYSNAIDWTYKLDRSKETSDNWLESDLKRNLVFKYKSDNDDAKVKYRGEHFFNDIQDEYPYYETLPPTFKKGNSTFENPFFAGTYNAKDQDTVFVLNEGIIDTAYSACLWTENVSPNDINRPVKGDNFLPRLLYWNKYSPTGLPSPFGTFGLQKYAAVQTWSSQVKFLNPSADFAPQGGILSNIYPQATMLNRDSITSPNLAYDNAWINNFDDATGIYAIAESRKGLYETYYKNMIEMLKSNPRLRTVSISLNITDIVNLDFTKLVYIDGVYWRINRVTDYMPNNNVSTKVELIEWFENGSFAATAPTFGSGGTLNDDGSSSDIENIGL